MPQTVEIVTPQAVLFKGEADFLVCPGKIGQLGILPGHAPLLTLLKAGKVRVKTQNKELGFEIKSGYLEVLGNKVKILAKN
jgi:F-type H+-transporting ATPase subunit epsilon